ncbi:MAG: hypothetical protein LAT54_08510 [Cryomorphaceae bacterium]|nr:hypothetical protein [Cryomorphaceae bacterium]
MPKIFTVLLVSVLLANCAREETIWPIVAQSRSLMPDSVSQAPYININDVNDTVLLSFGAYIHNVVPIGDDGEAVESTSQLITMLHSTGNETFNLTIQSKGFEDGDKMTLRDMEGNVRWAIEIFNSQINPGEFTGIFPEFIAGNDTLLDVIVGERPAKNIEIFIFQPNGNRRFIALKKDGIFYKKP